MGSSSVSTPKYDMNAAQNEQVWAAEQNRKYGNVGVNSALGGYEWITMPDGTQSIQVNQSANDQTRNSMMARGLSGIDMSAPDTSAIANYNLDPTAAQDAAYNMATRYLNKDFANQTQNMEAGLAAKGIPIGSTAYNKAMEGLHDSQNTALAQAADQAMFSGQQYAQQGMQGEISRLGAVQGANAQQIANVGSIGAQTYNPLSALVQGTGGEFGGNYNNMYNGQVSAANAQNQANAARDAAIGSAIGTAGGLAAMKLSDERLKENLKLLDTIDGVNIYEFNYIGKTKKEVGVIAQEIKDEFPEAVVKGMDGYYKVVYSRLPVDIQKAIEFAKRNMEKE